MLSDSLGLFLDIIVIVIFFIPTLAVTIRRLHDINKSGWNCLIGLIPAIGWIVMVILLAKIGSEEENKYGTNPLVTN